MTDPYRSDEVGKLREENRELLLKVVKLENGATVLMKELTSVRKNLKKYEELYHKALLPGKRGRTVAAMFLGAVLLTGLAIWLLETLKVAVSVSLICVAVLLIIGALVKADL